MRTEHSRENVPDEGVCDSLDPEVWKDAPTMGGRLSHPDVEVGHTDSDRSPGAEGARHREPAAVVEGEVGHEPRRASAHHRDNHCDHVLGPGCEDADMPHAPGRRLGLVRRPG